MRRTVSRLLWISLVVIALAAYGCGGAKRRADAGDQASRSMNTSPPASTSTGQAMEAGDDVVGRVEITQPEVVTFLVIVDASGSQFLPTHGQVGQVKLKVVKDVVRRMNPYIPERPLTGAMRRIGYEAGAWSERTALIYPVTDYRRRPFGESIEIIQWAGGFSNLENAIDRAGEDLRPTSGQTALIIISDGRIMDNDPVAAARRIKNVYGDRLCIYTVLVGDLPYGKSLLEKVVKEGACGFAVTADELNPEDVMRQWVDDVFSGRRRIRPAGAPPPKFVDTDGDGVPDHLDQCPNTPRGARVDDDGCWILERVQFDLNKWNIKPQYRPMLDAIAQVLVRNPSVKLEVGGHTCNIWTEEYNMKLSHWRAIAVTSYLMKRGVPSHQLSVVGYGLTRPRFPNTNEHNRSLNRRVEFKRLM